MEKIQKSPAYIFDIDGTLANVDGILMYLENKDIPGDRSKADWLTFYKESIKVPINKEAYTLYNEALDGGYKILMVTARMEKWREYTDIWLDKYKLKYDNLYMRNNGDLRSDYDIKRDILTEIQKSYIVVYAVDDNPNIIKLWQEYNIPTTKIGNWDGVYR